MLSALYAACRGKIDPAQRRSAKSRAAGGDKNQRRFSDFNADKQQFVKITNFRFPFVGEVTIMRGLNR